MRDYLHSYLNEGTFSKFPRRRVGQKVHKITNIVKILIYSANVGCQRSKT